MNKLVFVTVISILFSFNCSSLFGQNECVIGKNSMENFNFPPGLALPMKYNFKLDLSYKLEGKNSSVASYKDSDLMVVKILNEKELYELKNTDLINYKYYSDANLYFSNLSNKVQMIFTKNELWYIYVFDQKLKNKLTTIK